MPLTGGTTSTQQDGDGWSVYVYPMNRGLPEFSAEHQLIEHSEKEDALVMARNRIDTC